MHAIHFRLACLFFVSRFRSCVRVEEVLGRHSCMAMGKIREKNKNLCFPAKAAAQVRLGALQEVGSCRLSVKAIKKWTGHTSDAAPFQIFVFPINTNMFATYSLKTCYVK